MVRNKKAFTLVETIISMMIISIVAIGALSSITKVKPRIDSITVRGQYGCWYWDAAAATAAGIDPLPSIADGQLVEWYFDERTQRTNEPRQINVSAGETCKLKLDQRPAHFYILASGAGDGINPAQVTSIYTPAINNELDINVGLNGTLNVHTTITTGDKPISANGATTNSLVYPGVYPANIKSCKVVQAQLDPTLCADGKCIESCDVVDVTTYDETNGSYSNEYKIRLNGLSGIDERGNPTEKLIGFNELTFDNQVTLSNLIGDEATHEVISKNNSIAYFYKAIDGVNVYLNFDYYDSSYIPQDRLLGFGDATYSTDTRSKMTKILENISKRRQSRLTRILGELNAGGPNKNGAVLIMW